MTVMEILYRYEILQIYWSHTSRVGQNHIYIYIYIHTFIYGAYTVYWQGNHQIYGAYIRFWPTLRIHLPVLAAQVATAPPMLWPTSCVCVCVCVYVYTHLCMYVYVLCVYVCMCTTVFAELYIYQPPIKCAHTTSLHVRPSTEQERTSTRKSRITHKNPQTYTNKHPPTHAHTRAHTHTHTHPSTPTHTHTHTHQCGRRGRCGCCCCCCC